MLVLQPYTVDFVNFIWFCYFAVFYFFCYTELFGANYGSFYSNSVSILYSIPYSISILYSNSILISASGHSGAVVVIAGKCHQSFTILIFITQTAI